MLVYALVFGSALVATWLLTPVARKLALATGVVDRPDVRKQHRAPVPYFGGVAVFAGVLTGLAVLLLLARNPAASFERVNVRTFAIVGGAAALFVLGLVDDIRHLRARHKLLVQLVVAAAMWFAGIRIDEIRLTETITLDFGVFSFPLTLLWIAGVTNAINFIDGLDGLAAGIGAISASAIGFVALQAGNYPTAAMLVVLVGALLGFLPHNRHPAKIFLGDAGSLMLGFVLATTAITCGSKSTAFIGVAAPFLALGLPILDMCFAVMRRWIERRGLFSSDRNHIHHRLLALGYSHARTVQILWLESAVLTGLAFVLLYGGTQSWQRMVAFGLVLLGHVWFFRATGAVRLKESYRAFRSAAARAQANGAYQHYYDELDLHFRSAKTFDEWWDSVQLAAQRLGFATLRLRITRGDDGGNELLWQNRNGREGVLAAATIPLTKGCDDVVAQVHVELPAGSIEGCGRGIEVFGRLLDRHPFVALPATGRAAARRATQWHPAAG